MAAKNPAAEHPVVLTHPETGEKVLFVNSAFTTHFSNFFNFEDIRYGQDFMPEAHHLMNYLTSQAAIPEYQVRLKWRTNTVAMWDNLQVQHYAVADYGNAPRKMLRATLTGTAAGLSRTVPSGESRASAHQRQAGSPGTFTNFQT